MNLYIYASDVDAFLIGEYSHSLQISDRSDLGDFGSNWVIVGETDINLDTSKTPELIEKFVETIEAEEEKITNEFNMKLHLLSEKKKEMLAITHQAEE